MKKNNLINIFIYLIFIVSIFAYETHIHIKYYSIFQMILVGLTIMVFLLILKNNKYYDYFCKILPKNMLLFVLVFLMIISTLATVFSRYSNSMSSLFIVFMYIINIFFYFIMLPVYLSDNKDFENRLFKFIILLIISISIFGIILYFKNGLFGYYLEAGRSGSIYFDPNFFAVVTLIAAILSLKCDFNKIIQIIICLIALLAIIVSGSRGTMLSLFICLLYYIFVKYPNKNILKKYGFIIISAILMILVYKYLSNIGFLRLYQGSNGRTDLLKYSFNKIKESPLFGFGYDSIIEVFKSGNFLVTSSHNSIVDLMLRYGIPTAIIQILIIVKSLKISFSKSSNLCISLLLIVLLVNMNTILYSLGGVGFPSMMLTISLGYMCCGGIYETIKIKYYNTGL